MSDGSGLLLIVVAGLIFWFMAGAPGAPWHDS